MLEYHVLEDVQPKQQQTGVQFRTFITMVAIAVFASAVISVSAIQGFDWAHLFSVVGWLFGEALWFVGPVALLVLLGLLVNPTVYPDR